MSLLSSYERYTSESAFIDITYHREEKLAGGPINGTVYDQIVATQRNCYDNPSDPGWYRINRTVTGNVGGGTQTDYKIRELSNWIYVCDCDSRSEAESTLGPPPGQEPEPTPTPTATATDGASAGDGDGGDGGSNAGGATPAADGPVTPTAGAGPGFGPLAALGGLVAAALLVIRREY